MTESLGDGLRGMRMGRVSAGWTRVTVNRHELISQGFFKDGRENEEGKKRHVLFGPHPEMVYYDHGIEFAKAGVRVNLREGGMLFA
jgi:hypothetical protein